MKKIEKYEDKRWYVSPEELAEQKRLLECLSERARRDSISGMSMDSHKSAPPNLNQGNGNVDFLTGELFETKQQQTQNPVKNLCTFGFEGLKESLSQVKMEEDEKEISLEIRSIPFDTFLSSGNASIRQTHNNSEHASSSFIPVSNYMQNKQKLNFVCDNLNQCSATLLPDGRPIMCKHEELPDYSAFEFLRVDKNKEEASHQYTNLFSNSSIDGPASMGGITNTSSHIANSNKNDATIQQSNDRNWNPFL